MNQRNHATQQCHKSDRQQDRNRTGVNDPTPFDQLREHVSLDLGTGQIAHRTLTGHRQWRAHTAVIAEIGTEQYDSIGEHIVRQDFDLVRGIGGKRCGRRIRSGTIVDVELFRCRQIEPQPIGNRRGKTEIDLASLDELQHRVANGVVDGIPINQRHTGGKTLAESAAEFYLACRKPGQRGNPRQYDRNLRRAQASIELIILVCLGRTIEQHVDADQRSATRLDGLQQIRNQRTIQR